MNDRHKHGSVISSHAAHVKLGNKTQTSPNDVSAPKQFYYDSPLKEHNDELH